MAHEKCPRCGIALLDLAHPRDKCRFIQHQLVLKKLGWQRVASKGPAGQRWKDSGVPMIVVPLPVDDKRITLVAQARTGGVQLEGTYDYMKKEGDFESALHYVPDWAWWAWETFRTFLKATAMRGALRALLAHPEWRKPLRFVYDSAEYENAGRRAAWDWLKDMIGGAPRAFPKGEGYATRATGRARADGGESVRPCLLVGGPRRPRARGANGVR